MANNYGVGVGVLKMGEREKGKYYHRLGITDRGKEEGNMQEKRKATRKLYSAGVNAGVVAGIL